MTLMLLTALCTVVGLIFVVGSLIVIVGWIDARRLRSVLAAQAERWLKAQG